MLLNGLANLQLLMCLLALQPCMWPAERGLPVMLVSSMSMPWIGMAAGMKVLVSGSNSGSQSRVNVMMA